MKNETNTQATLRITQEIMSTSRHTLNIDSGDFLRFSLRMWLPAMEMKRHAKALFIQHLRKIADELDAEIKDGKREIDGITEEQANDYVI